MLFYKPATKTLLFNDLYNPGFYPYAFERTSFFNRERLQRLARQVIDFTDQRGLKADLMIANHGFPSDNQVSNLRALASETPVMPGRILKIPGHPG